MALYGGRASAKSHNAAEAAVIQAANQFERVVFGRQYQRSLRESSKALIEGKIEDLKLEDEFESTKDGIYCPRTRSSFSFIGLEVNPNSVRSFEGATITVLEEAQDIKQTSIDTLIPTVLRTSRSRMWWLWNPFDKDTPVDVMFRGPHPPPKSYIQEVSYRDNYHFDNTGLRDIMEHLKATNNKKYLHIWEGAYYDGGESQIFKNTEVRDIEVPETIAPQFGLDFGSNNDPNALIKLYVLEREKIIYIAQEFVNPGSIEALFDGIKDISDIKNSTLVADSAWPQSISSLGGMGLHIVGARKGPGSVIDGIKWLEGYKIIISPHCPHTIQEARLYSWQTDKLTNRVLNVPEDNYNHCWDAIRYATEQNRMNTGNKGSMRF